MPDLDLSRLKELAQQAKQAERHSMLDRQFRKACSPDVILHLVQRLERAEREVARRIEEDNRTWEELKRGVDWSQIPKKPGETRG